MASAVGRHVPLLYVFGDGLHNVLILLAHFLSIQEYYAFAPPPLGCAVSLGVREVFMRGVCMMKEGVITPLHCYVHILFCLFLERFGAPTVRRVRSARGTTWWTFPVAAPPTRAVSSNTASEGELGWGY